MATSVKVGEEVTVGTTPVEYTIDETNVTLQRRSIDLPVRTSAGNAGTIKFAIGETPPASQEAVSAGSSRLLIGFENGAKNLWAVGSVAGQKFTIS